MAIFGSGKHATFARCSSIALHAAPTRRAAAPHEIGDDYRDLVWVFAGAQGIPIGGEWAYASNPRSSCV
jgi:hypothetical protein